MRSSSDWVRAADGSWIRTNTQQTRGLDYNHNHFLKNIFKGAATTVVGQKRKEDPVFQHYLSLLENGTKPPLAKLTIARQIGATTCDSIGNRQRDIWRRKGFRGEYHLFACRLCPPGKPNKAMGQRVPDRRMVPAFSWRTQLL